MRILEMATVKPMNDINQVVLRNLSLSVVLLPILVFGSLQSALANPLPQTTEGVPVSAVPEQRASGLATQPANSSPFSSPESVVTPVIYPTTEGYTDRNGFIMPSETTSAAAIFSQPGSDARTADVLPNDARIAPSTAATDKNHTVPGTSPMPATPRDRGTVSGSTSRE